ncbi:hypothetical protein RUND412_001100 [Rhizina undulata]
MEAAPHYAGHHGVGGEMSNTISSPNDPLFWLHHAFVDRIWWDWQRINITNRLQDISGFTIRSPPAPRGGYIPISMDDELDVAGLIPNLKIQQLMDTGGGYLCYEYD